MSRGFSLVELLLVVMVLMIVTAIAVPNYFAMVQSARETTVIAFLKQLPQAEELFNTTYGGYTDDPEELVDEGFISGTVGASASASSYAFQMDLGPAVFDASGHIGRVPEWRALKRLSDTRAI